MNQTVDATYLSRRYDRARTERLTVVEQTRGRYLVASQSGDQPHELILVGGEWVCDCKGWEYRRFCVHAASADLHRRAAPPSRTRLPSLKRVELL